MVLEDFLGFSCFWKGFLVVGRGDSESRVDGFVWGFRTDLFTYSRFVVFSVRFWGYS